MLQDKILNVYALEKFDNIIKDQLIHMYNTLLLDLNEYGYSEHTTHIYNTLESYDILMSKHEVKFYKRDSTIDKVLEK